MARFMTAVKMERALITVPVAERNTVCLVPAEDDCCNSGSGMDCPDICSHCHECPHIAYQLELVLPGAQEAIILCQLPDSDDGNDCTWVSRDYAWVLHFETGLASWVLVNYTTNAYYFTLRADWNCTGANTMEDALGGDPALVSQTSDPCYGVGWSCINGYCLEIGGVYQTQAECAAACGALASSCLCDCPCPNGVPPVWRFTYSNPGTCSQIRLGTVILVWDPAYGFTPDGPCYWTNRWDSSRTTTWVLTIVNGINTTGSLTNFALDGSYLFGYEKNGYSCSGTMVMTPFGINNCGSIQDSITITSDPDPCPTGCPDKCSVTYTAEHTTTFVAPYSGTYLIRCWGGGGGGGGGAVAGPGGGGGGAGGFVQSYITLVAGTSYPISIGAWGDGGAIGLDGTAGGDASFDGTLVIAHGGAGGKGGNNGGTGGAGGTTSLGGYQGGAGGEGGTDAGGGGGGSPGIYSVTPGGDGGNGVGTVGGAGGDSTGGSGIGGSGANSGGTPTDGGGLGAGGGGGARSGAGAHGSSGRVAILCYIFFQP